ncbi:penicillin-binding protein 2 [bacterium]|nr:penicillin-binding protein 2 [candidate division CSSED10-310 bacterium]
MTNRRLHLIFLTGLALLAIILIRLIHLQIFLGYDYARRAFRSHYRREEIQSRRGVIWDRQHRLLAVTLASDSLCADPAMVQDPETLARDIANILDGSDAFFAEKLSRKSRRFTWLQRNLTPTQAAAIQALHAPGLYFRKENRRFYPAGSDMSAIIGFTGLDGSGLEGLEASCDRTLAGSSGEELIAVDALARPYSPDRILLTEPQPGQDLFLTLDKTIQFLAVSELKKSVTKESARWGAVVVMDVHSGDILAMASEPGYNPHTFYNSLPENRRNRCTSQLIEPGSTFKAVTLASALERSVIDLNDVIDCENGEITIGTQTYSDWKRFGLLSIEDIIVFSSNVGTIKIGQRVGGDALRNFAVRLGFATTVIPEIPGSEPGYIRNASSRSAPAIASLSIGYGLAVTPLQLAASYAIFANGGWKITPRILMDTPAVVPERVISERTAMQVSSVLFQTVTRGTAKNGQPQSYPAAGKTGTARRYDHESAAYDPNRVTCVFAGFAPADSPLISVCVVVDDPQEQKWASQVTATLFSRIVDQTLLYLGEPPQRKVIA